MNALSLWGGVNELMNKFKNLSLGGLLVFSLIAWPIRARADQTREFMLSATYGALAGTLVGAATLAFSDKPGENLNKVARGASLGLYAGILLGLYVAYGSSNSDADDAAAQLKNTSYKLQHRALDLMVAPVIGDRGLEGAQASYTVIHF